MRKIATAALLLVSGAAISATNEEIVNKAREKTKSEWFPASVSIDSIRDFKFFADKSDTEYSRVGNVCGKVDVSDINNKLSLVVITSVTEQPNGLNLGTPQFIELDKIDSLKRETLSEKCK